VNHGKSETPIFQEAWPRPEPNQPTRPVSSSTGGANGGMKELDSNGNSMAGRKMQLMGDAELSLMVREEEAKRALEEAEACLTPRSPRNGAKKL